MMFSFRHKGLEQFFLKGDGSKLPAAYLKKIRQILFVLDSAQRLSDIRTVPGYGLHALKGDLDGFWAVKVSGNYRIIFRFIESNIEVHDIDYIEVHDIDYIDYH